MQTCRLALVGFGNVGQGLAQILRDQGDFFGRKFGVQFLLAGISDQIKGSLYDPQGLSPGALLEAIQQSGNLAAVPAAEKGWDAMTLIDQTEADALVELSYTDLKTGQPALDHIRLALQKGRHVVTSNKGPIALRYPELARLAEEMGVEIGVEGTVLSGTPALHLGRDLLKGAIIHKIQGILNGTTNYILTQMETGASYAEALAGAQTQGYAEADPTGDVEGYDAAAKVAILSNLLMEYPLALEQVERTGITGLTRPDIEGARAAGQRWKLIGTLERAGERIVGSVRPVRLPLSHPLANVTGATNAITYTTEILGQVTLSGPGAGRKETGYAIISDLLSIYRKRNP